MSADTNVEESKTETFDAKLEIYEPVVAKNTKFHSTYEAEYIFDQLKSKLQDFDITPDVNKNKWKMVFDMFKEQSDDEIKAELPQEGIRV
jgi:hypothetical protein